MATDIADDATHEDIQKFLGTIEEERKEEQTKDKTDAQRAAEGHDESTSTEESSGGDDDTAETGDESGTSEEQAQDWLDDDLKAEVSAYGIDEAILADFTSREELERAMRLFDKSAMDAGRKAMAESAKEKTEEGTKAAHKEQRRVKSEPKEGRYEIGLDKDVWPENEDMVVELTRFRDHYEDRFDASEARFDALETRFMEADAKAEGERFDTLVDSLGHADLFGKTGKESPKELERRENLLIASKSQQVGLEMFGRTVDLDKSLVNRAANGLFAVELGKKALKAKTRKISNQSDGRGGGGTTRSQDPPETAREEADRKYKELDGA